MIPQTGIAKETAMPTPQTMIQWLIDPLTVALGDLYGRPQISLLSRAEGVMDGTTVLLIRDSAGKPRAVALCSAPIAPDMVRRAMSHAREAKLLLGELVGSPILNPLTEGYVRGLSYAVLPYCADLSNHRTVWWLQRRLLRPLIFNWLWRVTECSVCDIEPAAIDHSFAEPLRRLASLGDGFRVAARWATGRLDAGVWVPKHVLMHGDLWKGNILIRPKNYADEPWRERFVVIDWAGSETGGYAMYDLVRLSQSMRLTTGFLRNEVARHSRLLECEPVDAKSYLLAALGHIYMNLEHFPLSRFSRMAEDSFAILERALPS